MESLNDVVQRSIEANRRMFEHKGISVELDLGTDMPEIYDDFTTGTPLNDALNHLNVEVEDAKPNNALYQTKYERGVQRLMISHDGNPIPQGALHHLNEFLGSIADGKKKELYARHGNLMAGQAIKEYGGRILLENIDENRYRVRTTMEIPVKAPSSK